MKSKWVIIILFTASILLGDKLYLKNGDIKEGEYIEVMGDKIYFNSGIINMPTAFHLTEVLKVIDDEGNEILSEDDIKQIIEFKGISSISKKIDERSGSLEYRQTLALESTATSLKVIMILSVTSFVLLLLAVALAA